MTVKEQTLPAQEVRLSENERITRAMKNHPGLKLGNFGQNSSVAVVLRREEVLAAHKVEATAIIGGATLDDTTPEAKKIRSLRGAAVQQSNRDWEYGRGGPSPLHNAVSPPPTPDPKRDRRRE